MKNDILVEFQNVEVIADTDRAILIKLEDSDEEVWIPRSQILKESDVETRGDIGTLVVHKWIALKKNLI